MTKDNLKVVIKEFHESALPDLIERKALFDFSILQSPVNKVITIIGPRRAGKTFFLFQIIKKLYILDAYFELYEKKALVSGLKEFGIDTGTIITDSEKRVEQIGKHTLNIVPICEWLLAI